ncbi:MAG: di-trans,poly-cis-decaprenylcistransferase [Gemmatimonadaceae bacterium]|nr:di-trans,poly-cis-decaprenylcistransferase [Gemmatimonadaceae bacterium]
MRSGISSLPGHLAIIMDGNGRWAERLGRPRFTGHVAGARAMQAVVSHCAAKGVEQLTLYAFSRDNWSRPVVEVNALLDLFTSHFNAHTNSLVESGIRLSVIGRRTRLPVTLRNAIAEAEARTTRGRRMHLRVAIDYSSRAAIQDAMPALTVDSASPDGSSILPPVDLLLRTGGERRLSDFLLWECAYAELRFVDVLWPDIANADLDAAFTDYARRDRRFGNVSQRASA